MAAATMKKKKRRKGNLIKSYFRTFGLKQLSELGLIIGAIVMFVGFFVPQIVQVIGIAIVLASALCGVVRSAMILIKNKNEKKSPLYKSGISMLVFWSVLIVIGVLGIVFYFV